MELFIDSLKVFNLKLTIFILDSKDIKQNSYCSFETPKIKSY